MEVFTIFADYIKNFVSKLNEYTLLQLLWVIAIYYFVLNSIFDFVIKIDNTAFTQSNLDRILEYNKTILNFLQDYEIAWIDLTVLTFLASMIVVLVAYTLFKDYIFIRIFSIYGGVVSMWSLIIYATYKLYIFFGLYYGIVLFFILLIVLWINKKKRI
ncbi:hypothetical protein ciss_01500 [Carboxydothermus islandicus]|uniref:Uncharacterized protein n=1 Tax=Carboxydothermus islandicus TaxID=661089 RepID=A0A1L8CZA3_9THEO|nr:hypothetical protein [Carboxydothermus islandicus]GAV24217.1 hypothetical protein ciss_01500 [Carboxydothermus islandicus]